MADYTRAHTIRELRACGWDILAAASDVERGERVPQLAGVVRRLQALGGASGSDIRETVDGAHLDAQ